MLGVLVRVRMTKEEVVSKYIDNYGFHISPYMSVTVIL